MKRANIRIYTLINTAAIMIFAFGCNKGNNTADTADTNETEATVSENSDGIGNSDSSDEFHAADDLMMTLSSLSDAIGVGEKLDPESSDYNYRVVLTDGESRMLYYDEKSNPGEWEVKVIAPDKASVKTISNGAIPAEEIVSYFANASNMGVEIVIKGNDKPYFTLKGARIDIMSEPDNIIDNKKTKSLEFIISKPAD